MTTPTVAQVVQIRRPKARPTLASYFGERLAEQLALSDAIAQPCGRYQKDPCSFAADVLGIALWAKQIEILEAARDFLRVSVRSGHKCGKSTTAAVLALWFYFSFPDGRVICSSVTSRQVDQILWREIRRLRARAKTPILGEMHELARSGFKADAELGDFREIVGFTAREAEAVAGISGANLLYLLDEASGIGEEIFEAIEGNRAGGARLVMFSNPTRTEGEFYRSHTDKALDEGTGRGFYKTVHVSSEDTPNVREGRTVIPGLAGRDWVEEKRLEWGPDSALFKIRVRGEFVEHEDGKILSVDAIDHAEARWEETEAVGRLHVAIDPAGPGEGGDESAFAVRRGKKIVDLIALRGLTEEAHVAHALGILKTHRHPREQRPIIAVDREGPIGARIFGLLRARADEVENRPQEAFEVLGVRSSDRALRDRNYDRLRDELWANFALWIREGGAIPEDAKLARDLHAPEWVPAGLTGRLKVTPKKELRKLLGRSPDRGDAVVISVWEPMADELERGGHNDDRDDLEEPAAQGMNPFAALDAWRTR